TNVGNAEWSPRAGHRVIEFQGALWLYGGDDGIANDFSTTHSLNDVWSSTDGLHWTQRAASSTWSPRERANMLVLGDRLYMLGSDNHADVWSSSDGASFAPVSAEAPWKPRYAMGTAVF